MGKDNQLNYSVSGRITDYQLGQPIKDLLVKAFDKDFFREQFLGSCPTDNNGNYQIKFSRDDYTGSFIRLERHPDIYIVVYDGEKEIYSTKKSVVIDANTHTTIDAAIDYLPKKEITQEIQYILGTAVNLKYLPKLSTINLVDADKLIRNPELKVKNIELIKKAFPELSHKHNFGDECGEGTGEAIRFFLKERQAEKLLVDADDFPAGTTIKSFFTQNIIVKYTLDAGNTNSLTGTFADLPTADSNFDFPDGTAIGIVRGNLVDLHPDNTEVAPSYVQRVGLIAEFALSRFINPTFSFIDPRNGAARLEYRILAQAAGTAGQTSGSWSRVEVDIDNPDTSNFGTVPHEMFHQVQYRYNNTTTRTGIYGILREGGARLAEDSIFDRPNRYAQSAGQAPSGTQAGIFTTPEESILDLSPLQTASGTTIRYAAGLFWKYIAEHHSVLTNPANEPAIGIDTYRIVLEETGSAASGYTVAGLRKGRQRLAWCGRFERFSFYDAAKTELNSHENTWGNYLLANYLHDQIRPGDADYDERYDYKEDEDTLASVVLNSLRANIQTADSLVVAQGGSFSRNRIGHKPYSAYYYEVRPSTVTAPRMIRIDFTVSAGMTDPIIQIVRLGAGDSIVDIHKSDKTSYSKTINMQGLSRLIVVVGSREISGDYSLNITEVASASDVMVTRWNSRVGNEYEVDPKGWAWTWVSPDIMVDTNDDGLEDAEVFFGINNKLKVRLRNRGNTVATNIQINFWYQKATPYLTTAGWLPVQNLANITQQITGETLNESEEKWISVDWCPDNDGTDHNHWCVKVQVIVAGDPNTDNKMAFRNFNNVTVNSDGDIKQFAGLLRNLKFKIFDEVQIIPRGTKFNLELLNAKDILKPKHNEKHFCNCEVPSVLELPDDLAFGIFKVITQMNVKKWDNRITSKPNDTEFYYPVDERTLPPGVNAKDLVTLTHEVNGNIVGGVTYRLKTKE
ncbi:MAG: hypothetical protein IPN54_17060 [Bacteroidetes bacterium]|nr:hypothetical protein [Bacteroidota bacterium]